MGQVHGIPLQMLKPGFWDSPASLGSQNKVMGEREKKIKIQHYLHAY